VDEIDASAYGSLGTNTNSVIKQGILPAPQVLSTHAAGDERVFSGLPGPGDPQ